MNKGLEQQALHTELMKVFSRNFKRLIGERGISQVDAATFLRLTPATVTEYVKGRRVPEWVTVQRICDVFKISPGQLFASDNDDKIERMILMTRSYLRQLEALQGEMKL